MNNRFDSGLLLNIGAAKPPSKAVTATDNDLFWTATEAIKITVKAMIAKAVAGVKISYELRAM